MVTGVERLLGLAGGEQPPGVGVGGGVHVGPVVDELGQQGGERFGHGCGRVAEPEEDLVFLVEELSPEAWTPIMEVWG
ncbi:MAG: hypothetical protein J2P17_22045 [Mycobacterium sp.]|nr:hypothetical protein [Mycobacterium sp.]